MNDTVDVYLRLSQDLNAHSSHADRSEAKKLAYAFMWAGVLPARETFVVAEWLGRIATPRHHCIAYPTTH